MRIPRLLVVADGDGELPLPIDCLEDWVTSGAPEWEVDARRHALVLRSGQHAVRPLLDEDGLLHHRDAWVSLSPVEQALAGVLLDRFGAVVTREMLADRAWPAGRADPQRARRARAAPPPPHRAGRARDPHGPVARLSDAVARGRALVVRMRFPGAGGAVSSVAACDSGSTAAGRSPMSSTDDGRVAKVASTPDDPARAVERAIAAVDGRRAGSTCSRTAPRSRRTRCSNGEGHASRWSRRAASSTRSRSRARSGPRSTTRSSTGRLPSSRASCASRCAGRLDAQRPRDRALRRRAARRSPTTSTSIAVCLLHADLDARHERAVAAALRAERSELVVVLARGEPGVPRVRADGHDRGRGVPRTRVRARTCCGWRRLAPGRAGDDVGGRAGSGGRRRRAPRRRCCSRARRVACAPRPRSRPRAASPTRSASTWAERAPTCA